MTRKGTARRKSQPAQVSRRSKPELDLLSDAATRLLPRLDMVHSRLEDVFAEIFPGPRPGQPRKPRRATGSRKLAENQPLSEETVVPDESLPRPTNLRPGKARLAFPGPRP